MVPVAAPAAFGAVAASEASARGIVVAYSDGLERSPGGPIGCPRKDQGRWLALGQSGRHWAAWSVALCRSLSHPSDLWPWYHRQPRSDGPGQRPSGCVGHLGW